MWFSYLFHNKVTKAFDAVEKSRGSDSEKHWYSRLVVESLDLHRFLPDTKTFFPFANSKHSLPVKSDVYGAGILKAEEPRKL